MSNDALSAGAADECGTQGVNRLPVEATVIGFLSSVLMFTRKRCPSPVTTYWFEAPSATMRVSNNSRGGPVLNVGTIGGDGYGHQFAVSREVEQFLVSIFIGARCEAQPDTTRDGWTPFGAVVRLRPATSFEAAMLQEALCTSATFRSIAATLETSDLIVYVNVRRLSSRGLAGGLQFVAATATNRVLRAVKRTRKMASPRLRGAHKETRDDRASSHHWSARRGSRRDRIDRVTYPLR